MSKADDHRKPRKETPIAIALGSEPDHDLVPKVVASGRGSVAEQILAIAFAQGIRVREDADLAELLSHVDIDSEVPLEAFTAVAEILAYVYRANGSLPPPTGGPEEPEPPTAITAP